MSFPFFIVGVPRSGTTLLSVILNNHSSIYIDRDSLGINLLETLRRFKYRYCFAPHQDRSALLKQLSAASYRQRISSFLDVDRIDQFDTFRHFFNHSVALKLTQEEKKRWGDKTPDLSAHVPELKALLPQAKFIHIVRNPFANCKSLKERQYMNVRLAAQRWKDTNAQGLYCQYLYGKDGYLMVRYEDLILNPAETVRQICGFLDVPFEGNMLQLEEAEGTQMNDAYVDKSLNEGKLNEWKTKLRATELKSITSIAGDLMPRWGYEPPIPFKEVRLRSLSFFTRLRLETVDILKMLPKGKRQTMSQRRLVTVRLSFRKRLAIALGKLVKLYFSELIYHIFLQVFKGEYKRAEAESR